MDFTEAMDRISRGFEVLGVAVLTLGFALAVWRSLVTYARTHSGPMSYRALRNVFGWSVLLSLEILVAADLIRTVAVQPTLSNVAVLGLIVLIRTFLSFSLDIEIEGVLPWRRGPQGAAPGPSPDPPTAPAA